MQILICLKYLLRWSKTILSLPCKSQWIWKNIPKTWQLLSFSTYLSFAFHIIVHELNVPHFISNEKSEGKNTVLNKVCCPRLNLRMRLVCRAAGWLAVDLAYTWAARMVSNVTPLTWVSDWHKLSLALLHTLMRVRAHTHAHHFLSSSSNWRWEIISLSSGRLICSLLLIPSFPTVHLNLWGAHTHTQQQQAPHAYHTCTHIHRQADWHGFLSTSGY